MSQLTILKTELTADPLARGYSGMTDLQAATSLNTVYRTVNRPQLTSAELLDALDEAEYDALTTAQKGKLNVLLGMGAMNVEPGKVARGWLLSMFGVGTATRTALVAAVVRTVSRAEELGLPVINAGMVQKARA